MENNIENQKSKFATPARVGIAKLMESDPDSKSLWKKRSTVPTKHVFQDASQLMQAAFEYFEWAEKTPHYSTEWKTANRSLQKVKTPLARVFTLGGFALFMGLTESMISKFRRVRIAEWAKSEDPLEKQKAEEFAYVFDWVDNVIRVQKFEKAVVGVFKEGLIKADLGIADKHINENINYNATNVSKEEMIRISDELEQQF